MGNFKSKNGKSNEELQQLQELKHIGLLASSITHSFNNSIGVIRGYADLIARDTDLNDRSHMFAEHIMKEADLLKILAERLRVFTKQKKCNFQLISIQPVIEQSIKIFQKSLRAPVKIQLDIPSGNTMVLADTDQIQQVIIDLCGNAYSAVSENGGILKVILKEIDVKASFAAGHECLNEGRYAKLTISDTGHGMDQETSKRIFEPFFTDNKTGEHAGLGLSVAKEIVKIHKGEIIVESKIGEGTIVDIYLPLSDKSYEKVSSL